jgi:hypothetical protein
MTGKEFFDKSEAALRSLCDDLANLSPEEFKIVQTAIIDPRSSDGVHSGSDIGMRARSVAGIAISAVEHGYQKQDTRRGNGHAHKS